MSQMPEQTQPELTLEQRVVELEWELTRSRVRAESLSKMLVQLIDDRLFYEHSMFGGGTLSYKQTELLRQIREVLSQTTTEETPNG